MEKWWNAIFIHAVKPLWTINVTRDELRHVVFSQLKCYDASYIRPVYRATLRSPSSHNFDLMSASGLWYAWLTSGNHKENPATKLGWFTSIGGTDCFCKFRKGGLTGMRFINFPFLEHTKTVWICSSVPFTFTFLQYLIDKAPSTHSVQNLFNVLFWRIKPLRFHHKYNVVFGQQF